MKDLVKKISDLFYKEGPLSKEDLEKLNKAVGELKDSPKVNEVEQPYGDDITDNQN